MKVTLYLRLKHPQSEIVKYCLNLVKARDSILVEIVGDRLYNIMEVKPHYETYYRDYETYIELREEEFMSLPICADSEFIGVLFEGDDELNSKVVL